MQRSLTSRRPSVFVSRLKVLVTCAAVGVACTPGEKPPNAPVHGTLALGNGLAAAGHAEVFRVVAAAPQGTASGAAELSLVFSRPVVGLETAEQAVVPPFVITPDIPGRWLPVGTSAFRFVPASSQLPRASRYVVEVPGTVRSQDGQALGAPYQFTFETPRPKVVRTTPGMGERDLALDQTIEVELNQATDPVRFQKATTLVAETSNKKGAQAVPLAFTATRPDPREPKKILVRPSAPLPKDSGIRLVVAANLQGQEGPLLSGEPSSFSYRTYGPLRVDHVDCDHETPHAACGPAGAVGLSFTNPVRAKDLLRAVTVVPNVKVGMSAGDDADDYTSYIELAGLQAGKSYRVTVSGNLTDRYGQTLGTSDVRDIVMDDYFPRVEIGVTGDTLLPTPGQSLPIGSVNAPSYRLTTAAIRQTDLSELLPIDDSTGRRDYVSALPAAKVRKIVPGGSRNRIAKENVSIQDALGAAHGVLAVGIDYDKDERDSSYSDPFRLLKVTDLGISAKVSRNGSLVWVTRLSTGEPVAHAVVELEEDDKKVRTYRADESGFARISATDYAPDLDEDSPEAHAVLVAKTDDDWTFERVQDHLPEWRVPVSVDLSGTQHAYGMLFTERGVYRPGDTVRVKGIVRQESPTGNTTPSGQKVELVLKSPEDEDISTTSVTTSRFGTFATDVKVPETARLGSFQLTATGLGVDGNDVIYSNFDVAEYRPAEFKVGVETDQPSYVRGAKATFTVRGDYLFGAKMPGAAVHYEVARAPTSFAIPDSDGLSTDASAYYADLDQAALGGGSVASADAKLDGSGTLTFASVLDLPGQRGPEAVRIDAEVTDVSRQSISSSASAIVHPADFYVGLAVPEDGFVDAPADLDARVSTLLPSGKRVAGRSVHVELLSRRWTLARQDSGNGNSRVVTKVVDKSAASCTVISAEKPAPCRLHVAESGYYVVVARAKDDHGRVAESAYGVYAIGSGPASFGDNDRGTVDLVPNKKEYRVGETARVLVKSPFAEADAWVTVERAGVYHEERVHLKGPTPAVSVPITPDLMPNAFVAVHLLRPAGKGGGEGALYRVGYASLPIESASRRLQVAVLPGKTELAPGEEVTVDLAAKDAKGKPAATELTVYAVDEGVLMLTGYKTPDPLPVFNAARPLQVATVESRESMAKISLDDFRASLGMDKGRAGGGGGEAGPRSDFRQTAYFNPSVVTDANGHAVVKFKLPDGLSTYRIMAVAATTGDQYGFGSASVVTSRKLMARPNLPRFLRAGDRARAGIVLSAKKFGPARVTVRAAVTGVTLGGPAERVVDLGRDQSVEITFPIAADTVGDATFRFDVSADGAKDSVQVTRHVEAPAATETVALYGSTSDVSAEALGDYSAIRPDTGGMDITLASSALVGLSGSATQLEDYPYGCTEQLSSRVLPLLPLADLATALGFAMPKDASIVASRTIGLILERQRGDGGFGMWPESTESYPWVSAYATWVLDQAVHYGARVPESAGARAHDYLRRYLDDLAKYPERKATAAFVVDVLSDAGLPDQGYMSSLFATRKDLPLFSRAFLLHALSVGKAPKESVTALAQELSSELRIANDAAFVAENVGDEYAPLFDSTARTGALVLRGLLAADPKTPLAAKLARGLLSQRVGGTWRTTQEAAYALIALDAYRRAQETTAPAFDAKVWVGDRVVRTASFRGPVRADTASMSIAALPGPGSALSFEKKGVGTLFYEARLRYVPRTLPATPLDAGFTIQKALRGVSPAALGEALQTIPETTVSRFHAGDLVLADLVVVTPSPRQFVVVDDPLPAGFEPVDTSLATSAAWLDVSGSTDSEDDSCDGCESARDQRAAGRAFQESWYRREVRDDRVLFFVDHMTAGMYHYRYLARATTAGTFVVPPVKAEEMYTPETFGRTAATSVVVE